MHATQDGESRRAAVRRRRWLLIIVVFGSLSAAFMAAPLPAATRRGILVHAQKQTLN